MATTDKNNAYFIHLIEQRHHKQKQLPNYNTPYLELEDMERLLILAKRGLSRPPQSPDSSDTPE